MAFKTTSFIASQFEDFPNWWLKFFEPGTTTPKSMATDETGSTLLARAEISGGAVAPIGFFITTGNAILIPWVDGSYDAFIFPTAAEADANDTANAEKIADDQIGGESGISITEKITLASGQTTVNFTLIETDRTNFYLTGKDVDGGRLVKGVDFDVLTLTSIRLNDSTPAGTIIEGIQNDIDAAAVGIINAVDVIYDNAASGLSAIQVQAAIDELDAILDALDAAAIPYDNSSSELTSTNVKAALDEIGIVKPQLVSSAATMYAFENFG